MADLLKWLRNILVSSSQSLNAWLGGDPDSTLSARMGRAIAAGRCWLCRPVCALLNLIDKRHCQNAAAAETDEGKDEVVKL